LIDKYEDPFVKISYMIGGDEYLKVARSLLKSQDATDEEIASSTGLRINMVRKVLYDLFGKALITGVRVKDERKGWFVYRWRSRRDEVENFIENQKKKISERLQHRLDYENSSQFYHCGNDDCQRVTFENALEESFKCPSCGEILDLKKNEKAKFYSGDLDADQRRKNLLLSQDISREMKTAQEWAAALNRAGAVGQRLFGSKELGQMEFERKITNTLTIKGKFWAGNFRYDNPVMMWGSITSPYISTYEKHKTHIHLTKGNFRMIDSLRNKYDIDGGAKITVDDGDMEVGNVRGKRQRVQDPQGRVGMSTVLEHFSELNAPNGKIVTGDERDTDKLYAETVININLVDNVKVTGKNILVYGSKVIYDVEFFLKKGGKIRFYDQGSGFDISDDSVVNLENGKKIKIRDLKRDKLISLGGKDITYDYIDDRENIKKSAKKNSGNKFGFGKMFHK